jgi:hypothetical protein
LTVLVRVVVVARQSSRDGPGAANVTASPKRCDDTRSPSGPVAGMEANAMIQTLPNLTEKEHRKRVVAAGAWAGEQ